MNQKERNINNTELFDYGVHSQTLFSFVLSTIGLLVYEAYQLYGHKTVIHFQITQ